MNKIPNPKSQTPSIPHVPLEEQEKHAGKYIAVVDGKVIATGYSSLEVYQKVDALFPDEKPEDLIYDYVPREEMLILPLQGGSSHIPHPTMMRLSFCEAW